MFGNNDFTKKRDPLVDAVAKVMQENETRRQVEKQFQEEIGIQAKRELSFQKHAEYDRVLAERTAVALNEELKGNQAKIDANHNNKIDAQDFKILKAKKGSMEEEANDDMSDPNVQAVKAMQDRVAAKKASASDVKPSQTHGDRSWDKLKSIMANEEALDELSKKTLGSYIKKASHDVATKSAATGRYAERANKVKDETKKGDYSNYQQGKKDDATADKMFGKSWKRREGIAKAVDKMTKEDTQIDEVLDSNMKKLSYVMKAKKSIKNSDPKDIKQANDIANRVIGVKRVMKKLTKEETINEISDKVKAAYARKADKEVTRTNTMGVAKRTGGVGIEDAKRKMDNRKAGIKRSMSEEETLAEKVPSGDKYERMVKHIKDKYSKGGLSDKEKSIAYATAWKAKGKDSE